ncbi:MAG: response regulator transcription factor [Bacteroidetes bacterium]|nr:response regulator transcription factor [Bacteroidales bacterium]NJO67920.1 response regulator transcription factor [Bacteroidota bacterium]
MINCIVVDDEPFAIGLLEDFIRKVPFLELVQTCENALEALEILKRGNIDLMFLDIKMPDINGLDLLKSLKNPPVVIFTTAYSEFAVESYNLDALDYLLKPVPFDRFLRSVNKAREYIEIGRAGSNADIPVEKAELDYFFVKANYQILKINFSDILYLEGLKDYVKIYCGPKAIMTNQSMKHIESRLPSASFVRVHRSYIVSLDKITSITKNRVVIGDKHIPVSGGFRDSFFQLIEKNL